MECKGLEGSFRLLATVRISMTMSGVIGHENGVIGDSSSQVSVSGIFFVLVFFFFFFD